MFHPRIRRQETASDSVVQNGGRLPNAALGGSREIVEQQTGRMSGLEQVDGGRSGIQNDGHFFVDIVRGSGSNGAGAIVSRKSFHA